jgi:hypothetical protein
MQPSGAVWVVLIGVAGVYLIYSGIVPNLLDLFTKALGVPMPASPAPGGGAPSPFPPGPSTWGTGLGSGPIS